MSSEKQLSEQQFLDALRPCVARGVVWISAAYPDWQYRINLDVLDMCHTGLCILGQIVAVKEGCQDGFHSAQVDHCDECDDWEGFYGFDVPNDAYFAFAYDDETDKRDKERSARAYQLLQNLWVQKIIDLRGNKWVVKEGVHAETGIAWEAASVHQSRCQVVARALPRLALAHQSGQV